MGVAIMNNKDIIYGVIDDYLMDLSNSIIKAKSDEKMTEELSIKICKALKIKE